VFLLPPGYLNLEALCHDLYNIGWRVFLTELYGDYGFAKRKTPKRPIPDILPSKNYVMIYKAEKQAVLPDNYENNRKGRRLPRVSQFLGNMTPEFDP